MLGYWKLAVAVVLIAGALYGLHRLALRAEESGWIYYVKKRGSSSALSGAVLEVQSILEPSSRYVQEEKTRVHLEEDASGDPPVLDETRPDATE